MTSTEKERLLAIETAVLAVQKEVALKLHLTPEEAEFVHGGIKAGMFVMNLFKYGKIIGTSLMALGGFGLLVLKIVQEFT